MPVPRSSEDKGLGSLPPARSQVWGSAPARTVGRQLLSRATFPLPLLQELLAVLQQEGLSVEGMFCLATGRTVPEELLWTGLPCPIRPWTGVQPLTCKANLPCCCMSS